MEILYFQFAASLVIRRPRRAVALLTQCSVFCALVYLLLIFDLFLKIILIKTSFIHPSGSRQSIICKSKSLVTRTIVGTGVMARSRSGSTGAGGAAWRPRGWRVRLSAEPPGRPLLAGAPGGWLLFQIEQTRALWLLCGHFGNLCSWGLCAVATLSAILAAAWLGDAWPTPLSVTERLRVGPAAMCIPKCYISCCSWLAACGKQDKAVELGRFILRGDLP